jgi:hypothetical protein
MFSGQAFRQVYRRTAVMPLARITVNVARDVYHGVRCRRPVAVMMNAPLAGVTVDASRDEACR